jgi:hypothetical protein
MTRWLLVLALLVAFPAWADTETLSPDTETDTSTNLIGDLSGDCDANDCAPDVADDPDSPDGNWAVATENNTNTRLNLQFPTPTGNPTVGADLQEFKCWVREFDQGQGGTPEARIELWENGVLVRAGADSDVTTTGEMRTFTWNASELATADGSLAEVTFIGTKSGGSPGNRNTTDLGACEWNVDYTVGGGPAGRTRRMF